MLAVSDNDITRNLSLFSYVSEYRSSESVGPLCIRYMITSEASYHDYSLHLFN